MVSFICLNLITTSRMCNMCKESYSCHTFKCTMVWDFKLLLLEKHLPQVAHLNGRSPVCFLS